VYAPASIHSSLSRTLACAESSSLPTYVYIDMYTDIYLFICISLPTRIFVYLRLSLNICIQIRACMRCLWLSPCIYMDRCVYRYMSTCIQILIDRHRYTRIRVCIYVWLVCFHICIWRYIFRCVYILVYLCVHVYHVSLASFCALKYLVYFDTSLSSMKNYYTRPHVHTRTNTHTHALTHTCTHHMHTHTHMHTRMVTA